ncbi:MAG TPA: DUF1465 family protein [Hyphomicrobiaceae bacterium]|nr:DUF1465 family protein [Hyphomicrobiaceae bacterium]
MGSTSRCSEVSGVTVSFGEHFAASEQFDAIYAQGMALVERTAAYLDGPGRQEAKQLKPHVALTYSTESMRLTARLLDLASWLLIRRSLRDGDITEEEARRKRARLKLHTTGRPSHIPNFDELPQQLQALIKESFELSDRILRIDRSLEAVSGNEASRPASKNPVAAQIAAIQAAFNAAIR